jgi:hypothetical protein
MGDVMSALTELKEAVHANTTVLQSARTLIAGLTLRLEDVTRSDTPDADIRALVDELRTHDADLARAILANTEVANVPMADVLVDIANTGESMVSLEPNAPPAQ